MNIKASVKRGTSYQYLLCTAKRKAGAAPHETGKKWRADEVEKLFLDHGHDFDMTGLLLLQAVETPEQIEEAQSKVHTLDTELENLTKQLDRATEHTG
jgi:hypothetical protein